MNNDQPILKPIKSILVSQPQPTDEVHSPFHILETKFGVKVDYRSFIKVEGLSLMQFRKHRVEVTDYTAVIFSSKNAVDNYFRLCEEMRIKISPEMKYYCLTEQIALYLQKFILYRKRKVFFGNRTILDLKDMLLKNKKKDKFFVPTSNAGGKDIADFLLKNNFVYAEAMMYQTVSADLSDLTDITYDMLVFFSPFGIKSLFENFPDFKQNETRIGGLGSSTCKSITEAGLRLDVEAPTPEFPSITMAIEAYLKKSNPK